MSVRSTCSLLRSTESDCKATETSTSFHLGLGRAHNAHHFDLPGKLISKTVLCFSFRVHSRPPRQQVKERGRRHGRRRRSSARRSACSLPPVYESPPRRMTPQHLHRNHPSYLTPAMFSGFPRRNGAFAVGVVPPPPPPKALPDTAFSAFSPRTKISLQALRVLLAMDNVKGMGPRVEAVLTLANRAQRRRNHPLGSERPRRHGCLGCMAGEIWWSSPLSRGEGRGSKRSAWRRCRLFRKGDCLPGKN